MTMKSERLTALTATALLAVSSIAGCSAAVDGEDTAVYGEEQLGQVEQAVEDRNLFIDIMPVDLYDPNIFGYPPHETVALGSHLINFGTVPAPPLYGNSDAEFRLRNMDGDIVSSGNKGEIYFATNGGCPRKDLLKGWRAAGKPRLPGAPGGGTKPGCIDDYSPYTNDHAQVQVSDAPDGVYWYEIVFDANEDYAEEPSHMKGNNGGRTKIRLKTKANGRKKVTFIGGFQTFNPFD